MCGLLDTQYAEQSCLDSSCANTSQEDPYQLRLFGKGAEHIEVVTAEFLPDGEQLYIIAIDAEGVMHVLQFEPHSPSLTITLLSIN